MFNDPQWVYRFSYVLSYGGYDYLHTKKKKE